MRFGPNHRNSLRTEAQKVISAIGRGKGEDTGSHGEEIVCAGDFSGSEFHKSPEKIVWNIYLEAVRVFANAMREAGFWKTYQETNA